ncbi:F1F0 ATP synthase subunit g [Ascoidea rubescens DSM 1968]|uniref:Subunit G of the mitochondrial F1F0 ATP synthase n=1 Tax=Ascoidea rubescens DSM 1968 TaxID=1344418 RepID=A0A1D2VKU3_9ASCO|nr:subunit G of the mitochondrial F1F0 ATP synthase [Ascoidea rubescens DSM 1968]ODV62157.1 subunit G of the mitochondrial F1F0 ATP synthase [Ascoidea rubescens DSM 1968]
MFARTVFNTRQAFFRGIRHNSTSAKASALLTKFNGLKDCSIYWGKVTIELAKQIYIKENLAPPTTETFKKVYIDLYKQLLKAIENPSQILSSLKSIELSKQNVQTYGSYFVQLLGLFSLGEVIGRRKLVGYKHYPSH